MFLLLTLSISSGTSFFLVLSTLSFWLTESNVSPTVIGLFAWVTIPYSLKFLWSPFLDRFNHIFVSKNIFGYKICGFIAQVFVVVFTYCLGSLNPASELGLMALTAFCLSFSAATLDIVIDTLRIELCVDTKNGISAAVESVGFRLGMLIGGAGTLYIATIYNWTFAYQFMGLMQIMILPILWFSLDCKKVKIVRDHHIINITSVSISSYIQKSIVELKKSTSLWVLVTLLFLFKAPDTILNAMSGPFLYGIGFNKIEYANVTKTFGIPLMIVGSFMAGYIIQQFNARVAAAMVIFLQAVSCLLFVVQYRIGHDIVTLLTTVGIESFTSGMATTVFIALISSYCKVPFSAGHFTFLNAIGSMSRIVFSALGGVVGDWCGWNVLFLLTCLTMIPTFILLIHIRQYDTRKIHIDIAA